jgi:peroxiredoxin
MKFASMLAVVVCLSFSTFAKDPVPRPAGELTVTDPSGQPRSLSSYRGKVVLVQFLYTTCSHCQAAARVYNKLEGELGPRGFEILGVAFNPEAQGNPGVVEEFIQSNGLRFHVSSAPVQTVLNYLGISAMERFVVPQIVIVDRKGVIRAHSESTGTAELQDESYVRNFVEGLLNEGAKKPASR